MSAYIDAELVEVAAMLGANVAETAEAGPGGMPVGDPMDFLVR